jgi:hypothetical protein
MVAWRERSEMAAETSSAAPALLRALRENEGKGTAARQIGIKSDFSTVESYSRLSVTLGSSKMARLAGVAIAVSAETASNPSEAASTGADAAAA